MDAGVVTQIISTVGFPIAACCVMFYQNGKLQDTLTELTKTLSTMNERLSDVEKAVIKKDGE